MMLSPRVRYLIRFLALAYVLVLLIVPVGLILWRTFAPGFGQFFAWVSTPAAVSALNLSLLVVAIVVPLNVVFGIPTALMLARNRFRGKGILQAIIDLPFAVSPVVVGVALIVLWGSAGLLGFVEKDFGFRSFSGCPVSCSPASSPRCHSWCARSNRCCTSWGPIKSRRRQRWVLVGGRRFGGSHCRRSGGDSRTGSC